MKSKILYLFLVFMGVGHVSNAQVGIGTYAPNKSAQLDVTTINGENKGILIPRISLLNATDITTIDNGNVESLLIFNTSTVADVTPGYYYWYNNRWNRFATNSEQIASILRYNDNGIITYVNEAGNSIDINLSDIINNYETETSIINNGDGTITYKNEIDVPTIIDISQIIADHETLTTLSHDKLAGTITYVDEKGDSTVLNVGNLIGPQGIPGEKGKDGTVGPVGSQGIKGEDGAIGPVGPQGIKGDKGDKGEDGAVGAQGLDGKNGNDGAVGPVGPQGIKGDKGDKGEDGAVGAQGLDGKNGNDGAVGPVGPQGIKGDKGDKGEDGAIGLQGLAGTNGYDGAVGPVGPQGIKGDKGDKGEEGAVGVQGLAGINGNDGAVGPVGPQGIKGDKGEDGAVGAQGLDGKNGNDGAVGPVGPQGVKGDKGEDGAVGIQGLAGINGNDGAVGPIGPQGIHGKDGIGGKTIAGTGIIINGLGTEEKPYIVNTLDVNNWKLTGNAETTLSNFLGTINNTPLNFKVYNERAGRLSGDSNGAGSVYLGMYSGPANYNLISDRHNVGIGNKVLANSTSGYGNAAVGSLALQSSTGGYHNTAVGQSALTSLTTGIHNTALGVGAGTFITTGSYNIAIGQNAAVPIATGSDQLSIGNAIYGTGIGRPELKIGIGTNAPANVLHVKASSASPDPLRLEGLKQGADTDKIMVANADGVVKTIASTDIKTNNWSLTGNTGTILSNFLGTINNNPLNFKVYNERAGRLSGDSNGAGSVYLGMYSGPANYNLVRDMHNVGIGNKVLVATTGYGNTGIGSLSLQSSTSGYQNTAIGQGALSSLTTGYDNTALGVGAGAFITSGINNISIGKNAIVPIATGSDQLSIGNAIYGIGIGRPELKIGIGTNAPANVLHVKASSASPDPLRLEGLKQGADTDNIVVADANGVIKTIPAINRSVASIVKATTNYTVLPADYTVLVNATQGNITLTLPNAVVNKGRFLILRKTDETTNVLTFNTPVKISETSSFNTLNTNTTVRVQSDGNDWYKID